MNYDYSHVLINWAVQSHSKINFNNFTVNKTEMLTPKQWNTCVLHIFQMSQCVLYSFKINHITFLLNILKHLQYKSLLLAN